MNSFIFNGKRYYVTDEWMQSKIWYIDYPIVKERRVFTDQHKAATFWKSVKAKCHFLYLKDDIFCYRDIKEPYIYTFQEVGGTCRKWIYEKRNIPTLCCSMYTPLEARQELQRIKEKLEKEGDKQLSFW